MGQSGNAAGATAPARRSVRFEDGETSYLEWDGPVGAPLLVFLHANGFNAETYKTILSPLADRFRIIAPDHRGHGLTTRKLPASGPRWELVRDDAIDFLRALKLKPAVLAGHSMGATASLMAAGKVPDIAGALVLAEPVMQPVGRALYALWARMLGKEGKMLPRVGPTRRRRSKFDSREAAVAGYRGRGAFRTWSDEMVADYVQGGLIEEPGGGFRLACAPEWEAEAYARFPFALSRLGSHVRVPVSILTGEHDSATDDGVVRKFAQLQGHTTVRCVAGTTHFLPMETPDIFREAIIAAAS